MDTWYCLYYEVLRLICSRTVSDAVTVTVLCPRFYNVRRGMPRSEIGRQLRQVNSTYWKHELSHSKGYLQTTS